RSLQLDEAETDRVIAGMEKEPARRRSAGLVAEIIRSGGPWYRTVEFCAYGRAHSVVTRTPRELRAAFRIGEEPPVELDIRNCQPLLLGMMAAAEETGRTAKRTASRRADGEGQRKGEGGRSSSIPYGSANLHAGMRPRDLLDYIRTCESGRFYEELA